MNGPQRLQETRENQRESSRSNRDEGVTSDDMPSPSMDWILNSGIDDPELLAKLRLVVVIVS